MGMRACWNTLDNRHFLKRTKQRENLRLMVQGSSKVHDRQRNVIEMFPPKPETLIQREKPLLDALRFICWGPRTSAPACRKCHLWSNMNFSALLLLVCNSCEQKQTDSFWLESSFSVLLFWDLWSDDAEPHRDDIGDLSDGERRQS